MSLGRMSFTTKFCAAFGPAFPTAMTNATLVFGPAYEGPFFVTVRSAWSKPGVVTTAVLELFSSFGSKSDVTLAMLVKVVPGGVAGGACITKVKSPLEPFGKVAMVQLISPLEAPGAGVEQLNAGPLFWIEDTKVIPGGNASFHVTLVASSGPPLNTTTLKETSDPAAALDGPVFVARRSAPPTGATSVNIRWTASDARGTATRNRAVPIRTASKRVRNVISEILPIYCRVFLREANPQKSRS